MKRLNYHFEPSKGWMNDPNGLVKFRGKYHAFFQHNPHGIVWGPMHWGHAISENLVHWEELPIALYPDMPYENKGGCFSGSAIVKDDRLYLFYTSVSKEKQTQSMAYSDDGIIFHKYENNPIINQCPLGYKNFRDPKVVELDGKYYMVIGTGNYKAGQVLLFSSENLLNWKYIGILFEGKKYKPCMECPDFFKLGNRYVLMFSDMMTRSVLFIIGDFNGKTLENITIKMSEMGNACYAPQTFSDDNHRRIMIGWMWVWYKRASKGDYSAGAFTIPRELRLIDDEIYNFPCKESQHLLATESAYVKHVKNKVLLTNGKKTIRKIDGKGINSIHILEDTKTVEVFINKGKHSYTYYKAD